MKTKYLHQATFQQSLQNSDIEWPEVNDTRNWDLTDVQKKKKKIH